jgi:hypothetical protein
VAADHISILTLIQTLGTVTGVAQAKRITANLPEDLLRDAMKVTRKGITDTLVEGLRLIRRARAYEKAMALRGTLRLDVDLETSRERRHR